MYSDELKEALDKVDITLEEFSELAIRLLNYGVLCRSESQTEQIIYDRYVRVEELIVDYLSIIGVRLLHDRRFTYVRVYPPGATVPGMEDVEENAFNSGLRARLRQDEVALLLVLRLQYDKALREGKLDDSGYVSESMESLGIAVKNLLGRSLPDKTTDRKRIFNRLRQLRLIHFRQETDLEQADTWLRIHPMIVTYVTEDALLALGEALPQEVEEVADVS